MRGILATIFWIVVSVVLTLGVTVLVLRAVRNFGGGVGATVAGAAGNVTGLNV